MAFWEKNDHGYKVKNERPSNRCIKQPPAGLRLYWGKMTIPIESIFLLDVAGHLISQGELGKCSTGEHKIAIMADKE